MLKQLFQRKLQRSADRCAAVIVAAGSATRMQGEDKILSEIGGKTVICRTLEAFMESRMVDEIILVTRADLVGHLRSVCGAKGYNKVIAVVEGGATRVESVMRGLDCVPEATGLAAVHDGARPLIPVPVIDDVIRKAQRYYAAAPAIPVKDTIKIARNHLVVNTPDRASLYAVQTPQVFDYDLLRGALKHAMDEQLSVTDDCSAVEAIGMSVYLSEGSEENIKITTPMDLILAEAILQRRQQT